MNTWKVLTLVAGVVASTVGALAWFSSSVTQAIGVHGEHPHASTMKHLTDLQSADGMQNQKIAKLERVPEDMAAIRARIDLLLVPHHEAARRSPKRRARMKAKAVEIRSAASKRGDSDPLAGMEGL